MWTYKNNQIKWYYIVRHGFNCDSGIRWKSPSGVLIILSNPNSFLLISIVNDPFGSEARYFCALFNLKFISFYFITNIHEKTTINVLIFCK